MITMKAEKHKMQKEIWIKRKRTIIDVFTSSH